MFGPDNLAVCLKGNEGFYNLLVGFFYRVIVLWSVVSQTHLNILTIIATDMTNAWAALSASFRDRMFLISIKPLRWKNPDVEICFMHVSMIFPGPK